MLSLKLHYLMVDILVLHKYNERVDFVVVVVVVIFCFSTKQICSIHIFKIANLQLQYITTQPINVDPYKLHIRSRSSVQRTERCSS